MQNLIPAWTGDTLTPTDKLEVHQKGLRHPAISVFVTDGNRVLLQQRAAGKYHSGGLWSNTVCTHPYWGEAPADCAVRRLDEEMGITGLTPVHADRLEYRADVGNGLTEHEVVDIFLARASAQMAIHPDPAEVSDTRWTGISDLRTEILHHPGKFSRWLAIYLNAHASRLSRMLESMRAQK